MKDGLTTFEIEREIGIKRNRIKEWVPRYLKLSVKISRGRGKKGGNRFPMTDVCKIIFFGALIDRGFSREESGKRLSLLTPNLLKAHNTSFDKVSYIAFISRREGKYLDPRLVKPGVNQPFNIAYPEIITGEDLPEIFAGIEKYDTLANNSDDIIIINFRKIRDKVNSACK